jgi:hypothetical protein
MRYFFLQIKNQLIQEMSCVLVFSPKCNHCNDLIAYLDKHPQFNGMIKFHNINTQGMPASLKSHVKSVPTMLTKNGKVLTGKEIQNYLQSLLPNKELSNYNFSSGGLGNFSSIDGEDDSEIGFDINNYGQSLQPAMTAKLEALISRDVKEAYSDADPSKQLKI